MSLEAKSIAIVVRAKVHNPSILGYEFLTRNKIISENWGTPVDFMSVPAFSAIKFPARSIQISCQEERLQFYKQLDETRDFSDLVECASKYVSVLAHVPYKGLGVNCEFKQHTPEAATWAKRTFLAPSVLSQNPDISNTRLMFRFDFDDRCRLTVELRPLIDEQAVRILANCEHQGLETIPTLCDAISRAQDSLRRSEVRSLKLMGPSS